MHKVLLAEKAKAERKSRAIGGIVDKEMLE